MCVRATVVYDELRVERRRNVQLAVFEADEAHIAPLFTGHGDHAQFIALAR